MELKEFITETMSAIVDATSELQSKYADDGVLINPPSAQSGKDVFQPNSSNYTMRRVQNISFDVAVTASSEVAGKAKVGIKVMSLEIGGEGGMSDTAQQVSRVRFSVPITLKPSDQEAVNLKVGARKEEDLNVSIRNTPIPKRLSR